MNLHTLPGQNGTKRGDLKRCDFCGYEYPQVEVDDGQFVMVHPMPIVAASPLSNICARSGNPINSNHADMISSRRFEPRLVAIPHNLVCPVFAEISGQTRSLDLAAGPPLPDCVCGHAWTAHRHHAAGKDKKITSEGGSCRFKECACEGYREPEEVEQ